MTEEKKQTPQQDTQSQDATQQTPVEIPQQPEQNDPFARLKKKKVAVPKPLSETSGSVDGKIKRGRKISPKVFLFGCAAFFLVFLVLVFVGLYFIAQSNEFLQGIGLEVEDVKNILLIFAAMFFGIIFFIGFYLFVLNVYRLVTVKTKRKGRFILGLILGFFIILITIVAGTLSIKQIQQLGGAQQIRTNLLLIPWLETRDDVMNVGDSALKEPVPLIAPMKMRYQLNKQWFDRYIVPQIGSAVIQSFSVECGNGQTLTAGAAIYQQGQGGYFDDYCLYTNKGDYDLTMNVVIQKRNANTTETKSFKVTTMTVNAEIELVPDEKEPYLNDLKNEYIMGVAPILVDIKAPLLFSDLGLKNDTIEWDLDDDETIDIENNANFIYPFGESKLHTINYRLPEHPEYGDVWFTFDMRVIESDLAQCNLKAESIDGDKRWRFTPRFDELVEVGQYAYTIYDKQQETFIERNERESRDTHTYTFKTGGQYEVQVTYFTPEGEKGSCRPETIQVGHIGNRVSFNTRFRQDESTPFVAVADDTPVQVDNVNNEIAVTLLPAVLELEITDITPDPNADLKLYYDGRQVFGDKDDQLFEINIGTLGTKELKFVLTASNGKEEEQIYQVNVSRSSVKADMIVSPEVGEAPLEVTLDASISPLYDEEDEIVYFTWDFGDGTTRQNISAGKVTHVYNYDTDKDSGEYYPTVSIKTKKGYMDSYRLKTPIIVKKTQRSVEINVDSHPTRQARVGDIVTFSIETDGLVDHIDRDFGAMGQVGCQGRQCATTPVRFTDAGDYEIRVEVQYANDVPVTARTKIRVF